MPNDPTVQVALIGIVVTLITTSGIVLVALINNKKERGGAADAGVEATLRERLTLRDEQIVDLREERDEARAQRDEAVAKADEQAVIIQALRRDLKDRT